MDDRHWRTFNRAEHVAEFVGEAADAARLILEARLASLLRDTHVPEIPYKNLAVSCSYDETLPAQRHRVNLQDEACFQLAQTIRVDYKIQTHSFRLGERARARRSSRIPQFDARIPTARDDDVDVGTVLDTSDGFLVRTNFSLWV